MDRGVADTGVLVAAINAKERHHGWAVEQMRLLRPPMLTCEPVLAEAFYLLGGFPKGVEALWRFVETGALEVRFDLSTEWQRVRDLMTRYRDTPISLADACLVRMAELFPDHAVFTPDRHFRVFRKHRNQTIPLIVPAA